MEEPYDCACKLFPPILRPQERMSLGIEHIFVQAYYVRRTEKQIEVLEGFRKPEALRATLVDVYQDIEILRLPTSI